MVALRAPVVCLLACAGVASTVSAQGELTPVAFDFGFRYDPTEWLTTSADLDAVRLRALILEDPLPGDQAILDAEIDRILAEQQLDGHLGAANAADAIVETGNQIGRLLELGCPVDRPELQAAADRLCHDLAEADSNDVGVQALGPLCLAGRHDDPAVVRRVLAQRDVLMNYDAENAFGPGVARTPNEKITRMWRCRAVGGLEEALEHWLRWIEDRLEPTVCGRDVGLFLLWDAFEIFGEVDHEICERVAPRLVPVLLRLQQRDGTWGARFNFLVYRFLIRRGLLEPLSKLPPLPPDWEVVRDIPVPCESPSSLGWDGELLWVQDKATHSAIALAPEDGTVKRTIVLPGSPDRAVLGIWGRALALAIGGGVNTLYQVDSVSGKVLQEVRFPPDDVLGVTELGGEIVIADHWDGHLWATSSDLPGEWKPWRSAAGMPNFLTSHGDELWISDGICPLLIKTNRAGDLLDWGEKPFGWGGIACAGDELWALDRDGKRICVIERLR